MIFEIDRRRYKKKMDKEIEELERKKEEIEN